MPSKTAVPQRQTNHKYTYLKHIYKEKSFFSNQCAEFIPDESRAVSRNYFIQFEIDIAMFISLKGANSEAELYNTLLVQAGSGVRFTSPYQVSTDGASFHTAISQKKTISSVTFRADK